MPRIKPLIGVTTSARRSHIAWQFIRLSILMAGGRAVRLTALNHERNQECDGYVIAGGVDIDPQIYGQENRASIDIEPERDTLEQDVINHARKASKPLLGICRGAQMINIVFGGTLHQNARDFYEAFVPTDSVLGKMFVRRKVTVDPNSYLCHLQDGAQNISVNSLHHQAIDKVGDGLRIVAQDTIGIPQGIENNHRTQYILGVQWHPEYMQHRRFNRKIFQSLIKACSR